MVKYKMCSETKAHFIEAIASEQLIWDDSLPNYSTAQKHAIWERISTKMRSQGFSYMSVDECMKTWKNLKDYYRTIAPKPGSSAASEPRWMHYRSMRSLLGSNDFSANRVSSETHETPLENRLLSASSSATSADEDVHGSPRAILKPYTRVSKRLKRYDGSIMSDDDESTAQDATDVSIEKELFGMQPALRRLFDIDPDLYARTINNMKRVLLSAEDPMAEMWIEYE